MAHSYAAAPAKLTLSTVAPSRNVSQLDANIGEGLSTLDEKAVSGGKEWRSRGMLCLGPTGSKRAPPVHDVGVESMRQRDCRH